MTEELITCRECGSVPVLYVDKETYTVSLKCPKCGNGVQVCLIVSWNAMQKLELCHD